MQFHTDGTLPINNEIFVFGSNLAGRHGAGAAAVARKKFGAIAGIGRGRMSCSYAIPTKDHSLRVIPLIKIQAEVDKFLEYAASHIAEDFFITAIGCGLAGYSDHEIAPMFCGASDNCSFPQQWERYLANPS